MTAGPREASPRGRLRFVVLQVVVLAAVAATAFWRMQVLEARDTLPEFRERPLTLAPLEGDPDVVSEEELAQVLERLQPLARPPFRVPKLEHALRLVGRDSRVANPSALSGADILSILIDHRAFLRAFGDTAEPLLATKQTGVAVRVAGSDAASAHYDHLLTVLAETGVPLDHPLRTATGTAAVADLLEYSVRHSSLHQAEYEWTALAYLYYLDPGARWFSSEGQEITLDRLAWRMLRPELSEGVCSGAHRLVTLTAYLRADAELRSSGGAGFLRSATREAVASFLGEATQRLVASQSEDGAWGLDWWQGRPPASPPARGEALLVTGHMVEWWAGAPDELRPPAATVHRAAGWMVDEVSLLTDEEIASSYSFLTHVAAGLRLWRHDVEEAGRTGTADTTF